MKKIFLLALILTGIFFSQTVLASTASLSVVPSSLETAAGGAFSVSVEINPSGNQVCVVKGALVFENLSCQSITVSNTITAQTTPTCDNPNFTLGIPKCSSVLQNLMTVSVKSGSVGTGKINLSGVKIIGAGVDVPFNSQSGVYNIAALEPVKQETVQPRSEIVQQEATEPALETTTETPETFDQETAAVLESEDEFPARAGAAGLTALNLNWSDYFWVILIVSAVLIVAYGAYYFVKKKKEKPL